MSMSERTAAPQDRLSTPVKFLKGVGPARAEQLGRLELRTVADVVFFFPRTYEDLTELRTIDQLQTGMLAGVVGEVVDLDERLMGPQQARVALVIQQPAGMLRAIWFNQTYLLGRFKRGQRVALFGKPRLFGRTWQMAHPKFQILDESFQPQCRLVPVYSLTEGVTQHQMRRIVRDAVDRFAGAVDEVFPADFLADRGLLPIAEALRQIHEPASPSLLERARRRFIYQELLVLQLALAMRRWWISRNHQAASMPPTTEIDQRIRRLFPFPLTADQNRAIQDIAADMARCWPMNRLLQGDVGTGKTVVAEYAMLLAVAHRFQAAVMAPTEVLAQQHLRTLRENLRQSRVRIELLVGSLGERQRRETLERIERGEADIVVGTHAIVQANVRFARLGLVVIDEQHKFGVRQRATLKQAGYYPHYLVMTATPIPRTVSMTLFGDLDVSTIRQAPQGRQPVFTYVVEAGERERWWEFFRKKLREGRQGYVIAPLVDEPSSSELASVQAVFESLANGQLEEFRLDLIHGRLPSVEKQAAMESFRAGRTQVLVATSVVEVGIDVPNATLMTIESGERFGLAQLHQLRGRVSRGSYPGFVCVLADPQTDDARQRLDAFRRSADGFELAEIDFRLRGPGDLFSTRQHGLPPLRIADPLRDAPTLEEARRDAAELLPTDHTGLTAARFGKLYKMALRRYGQVLELGDVG